VEILNFVESSSVLDLYSGLGRSTLEQAQVYDIPFLFPAALDGDEASSIESPGTVNDIGIWPLHQPHD
jgi:hypothetical protein